MTPIPKEIDWDDQSVARIWSYYAGNRSVNEQYFSRKNGEEVVEAAGAWLDLENGRTLDYGCGPGHLIGLLLARARGGKVHGLEFEAGAAASANQRFAGHAAFGGVQSGAAIPSGYAAGSMDAVICIEVIEHLDDERLLAALAEMRRVLKPGGRLFITTPNEEDLEENKTLCPHCSTVFHRWQHVRSWSAASLQAALARAGFNVLAAQPVSFERVEMGLCEHARQFVTRLLNVRVPKPYTPHLFAVARKD